MCYYHLANTVIFYDNVNWERLLSNNKIKLHVKDTTFVVYLSLDIVMYYLCIWPQTLFSISELCYNWIMCNSNIVQHSLTTTTLFWIFLVGIVTVMKNVIAHNAKQFWHFARIWPLIFENGASNTTVGVSLHGCVAPVQLGYDIFTEDSTKRLHGCLTGD